MSASRQTNPNEGATAPSKSVTNGKPSGKPSGTTPHAKKVFGNLDEAYRKITAAHSTQVPLTRKACLAPGQSFTDQDIAVEKSPLQVRDGKRRSRSFGADVKHMLSGNSPDFTGQGWDKLAGRGGGPIEDGNGHLIPHGSRINRGLGDRSGPTPEYQSHEMTHWSPDIGSQDSGNATTRSGRLDIRHGHPVKNPADLGHDSVDQGGSALQPRGQGTRRYGDKKHSMSLRSTYRVSNLAVIDEGSASVQQSATTTTKVVKLPTDVDRLIPQPLRIPPKRVPSPSQGSSGSCEDQEDSSTGSNADPFKYDSPLYREKYKLSTGESTISRVLREIDSPVEKTLVPECESIVATASVTEPLRRGLYFDPTSLKALGSGMQSVPGVSSKPSKDAIIQEHKQVILPPLGLSFPGKRGGARATDEVASTNGDWETEGAESEADDLVMPVRPTGSSVADNSDEDVHSGRNSPRYGSDEFILQHPQAPAGSAPQPQALHAVRGQKNLDVALPKRQRFPFTNITRGPAATSALSKKNLGCDDPFQPGKPFDRNATQFWGDRFKKTPDRFAFRDSKSIYNRDSASIYEDDCKHKSMDGEKSPFPNMGPEQATGKDRKVSPSGNVAAGTRAPITSEHGSTLLTRTDRDVSVTSSMTANTLHSFKLLELTDAQAQQKHLRETGQTDETEDGATRARRANSTASVRPSIGASVGPSMLRSSVTPPAAAHVRTAHEEHRVTQLPSSTGKQNYFMMPVYDPQTPTPKGLRSASNAAQSHGTRRVSDVTVFPQTVRSSTADYNSRWSKSPHLLSRDGHNKVPRSDAEDQLFVPPISAAGQELREKWFWLMTILSIIPIVPWFIKAGKFDRFLVAKSNGEVRCLDYEQKRLQRWMCYGSTAFWVLILIILAVVGTLLRSHQT